MSILDILQDSEKSEKIIEKIHLTHWEIISFDILPLKNVSDARVQKQCSVLKRTKGMDYSEYGDIGTLLMSAETFGNIFTLFKGIKY